MVLIDQSCFLLLKFQTGSILEICELLLMLLLEFGNWIRPIFIWKLKSSLKLWNSIFIFLELSLFFCFNASLVFSKILFKLLVLKLNICQLDSKLLRVVTFTISLSLFERRLTCSSAADDFEDSRWDFNSTTFDEPY